MKVEEKLEYIRLQLTDILNEEPFVNDLGELREQILDMLWVVEEPKVEAENAFSDRPVSNETHSTGTITRV